LLLRTVKFYTYLTGNHSIKKSGSLSKASGLSSLPEDLLEISFASKTGYGPAKKINHRGFFRYFVKEVCHENPRLLGRDIQGSPP
jgi:hypothetical protein